MRRNPGATASWSYAIRRGITIPTPPPPGKVHLLRQNGTDILTTEKTTIPHNQLTTEKQS